ncbi:MAG: xanthine dehydrogenase family protein subunit M [Pseudomonadota bacterium]|nr:xanthine dehydrogenase family protein subunit M [Pseudomonadota bacterium]
MEQLRYEAPDTLEAAVALLSGESGVTRILAGGTDVLVQLHLDVIDTPLIVDIKKITELREIVKDGGAYWIGAAATGMELMNHPDFGADWPGVLDGVQLIGSIQIRGRATVGGNICNGSPAADSTPAMIAAGAVATIAGPNGRRDIPVEDICVGPGQTSLAKDEILVSFALPARPANSGDAYLRFTPRTEMDIAVVGVGVNLTLDGSGICTSARVSLGAVAATPLLVTEAADALIGTKIDAAALDNLAAAASAAAKPIDDKRGTKEYRIKVAGVLARRAATIALDRARQG